MNKKKRISLATRHNWHCWWCDQKTRQDFGWQNSATIEHVVPVSKGGTNQYWNLVSACCRCNSIRGSTDADEFAARARGFGPDRRSIEHALNATKRAKRRARQEEIRLRKNPPPPEPTFWDRIGWWVPYAAPFAV